MESVYDNCALYYRIKTPMSFWCRWRLNPNCGTFLLLCYIFCANGLWMWYVFLYYQCNLYQFQSQALNQNIFPVIPSLLAYIFFCVCFVSQNKLLTKKIHCLQLCFYFPLLLLILKYDMETVLFVTKQFFKDACNECYKFSFCTILICCISIQF